MSDHSVSLDFLGEARNNGVWTQLGAYHHDELGQRFYAGFLLSEINQSASQYYWLGLGGQIAYLDADGPDGTALPVGGMLSFPLIPGIKMKLQISGYYAPSVLAFNGLDKYYDAQARLVFDLMSNASLYVGYRRIHAGFEFIRDRDLDDGTYAGAILRF
ncbi:MAG: YfaZ family outer membrane protein [Gammaproteobacteria bacterium]